MTTAIACDAETRVSDADLVVASRRGDRGAFGEIVRRYQAVVSGVIYSCCGDLHRSEDLAQDAFLSAWKSLSGLREPQRLGAWLCQIARHRVTDEQRGVARERVRLGRVIPVDETTVASGAGPVDQAISADERELLWRTLSQVAEPYRETMVLYYRQGRSTADVARVTEVSDEVVRQRLARGRQMLREQVAEVLERGLLRSAPGPQFAMAVVAMLPSSGGDALAASVAGKAAAGAAKGAGGALATVAMWIGPALGVLGGVVGAWGSIRGARAGAERRVVVRAVVLLWLLVIAGTAAVASIGPLTRRYHWGATTFVAFLSLTWAAYGAAVVALVRAHRRRQDAVRQAQGMTGQPAGALPGIPERNQRGIMVAVAVVAGMTWMLGLALKAGDTLGGWIVAGTMAAMIVCGRVYVRRRPHGSLRALMLSLAGMTGAIMIAMLNWRMYEWFGALADGQTDALRNHLPRWTVNVFMLVIVAVVMGITAASTNEEARDAARPGTT